MYTVHKILLENMNLCEEYSWAYMIKVLIAFTKIDGLLQILSETSDT